MKLQMPYGCDSIGHGTVNYVVSNQNWQIELPDKIGEFLLANGKTGAVQIMEPAPETVTCPQCKHEFTPRKAS